MMLLQSYRVLDLTGSLGALCGKLLGDLGADVIKVEPPGGEPSRRLPPLWQGSNGQSQSWCWLSLNANKRGITLELQTSVGRDLFLRLVRDADFVLESFPPGRLDQKGVGYREMKEQNPSLIMVSITPFGQKGPYRDFLASDLEIMALGGAMSLAGEKYAEPMRVTIPQAPMWAGAEAAMGALTALAYRRVTGKGQHVDVSAQVAVMAALAHAPAFWDLNRINPERAGIYVTGRSITGARMRVFWPCKDGWINFILYGGAAGRQGNQQLVAWMQEKGAALERLKEFDWNTFDIASVSQEEIDTLEGPIGHFFATLSKQDFHDGAVKRGILGYPVFTVEDIYKDPQLSARQFWQTVGDPLSGVTLTYPGGFGVFNRERPGIRRPAPGLGQHNSEVYTELLHLSPSEIKRLEEAGVI
jgi:crotonobetainyl-CoA:carnitine CoA-transferase CaiB-like acyl-CoA transferase